MTFRSGGLNRVGKRFLRLGAVNDRIPQCMKGRGVNHVRRVGRAFFEVNCELLGVVENLLERSRHAHQGNLPAAGSLCGFTTVEHASEAEPRRLADKSNLDDLSHSAKL